MAIDWTRVKHFRRNEFKQPDQVSPELIRRLDHVRALAKTKMTITSSFRHLKSKALNKRTSAHQPDGKHIYHGVDVRVTSSQARHRILKAVYEVGFARIGVYDKHIHLDVARKEFGQNVTWWGKST